MIARIAALTILLFMSSASYSVAEDIYQTPELFISESFGGTVPPSHILPIADGLEGRVAKIMGSFYKLSETTYWMKNGRTAWILEDIGKYKPITVGIIVGTDGKLERVKVLIYRESHGWEVKHKFFTRQFKGAGLKRERKLNKRIDGISGATLSVNALKRLSALALLLHQQVSP